MGYYEEVMADSPYVYLRLDGDTTDSAGSGASISTGGLEYSPGVDGRSALSGSSDYLTMGGLTQFYDDKTFSIEAWFKVNNTGSNTIAHRKGAGTNEVRLHVSAGNVGFRVGSGSEVIEYTTTATYHNNKWHHVVLTCTLGQIVLYIDGAVAIQRTAPSGAMSIGGNQTVGTTLPSGGFVGQLDEVAFYTTTLPSTRVKAHYDAVVTTYNFAVSDDSPIGYIKYDGTTTPVDEVSGLTCGVSGTLTYNQTGIVGKSASIAAGARLNGPIIFTLGSRTHETWFRTTDANSTVTQLTNGSGSSAAGHSRLILVNGLLCWQWNNSSITYGAAGTSLADNAWHHVVGTYSGTTITLYVDGVQVYQNTAAPSVNSTSSLYFYAGGDRHATSALMQYAGFLDETAVYDYALPADRVLRHYQAATGGIPIEPDPEPPAIPFRGWGLRLR